MSEHRYTAIVPEEMFARHGLRRRFGNPRGLYRWLVEQVIQSEVDRERLRVPGVPVMKRVEITVVTDCDETLPQEVDDG